VYELGLIDERPIDRPECAGKPIPIRVTRRIGHGAEDFRDAPA